MDKSDFSYLPSTEEILEELDYDTTITILLGLVKRLDGVVYVENKEVRWYIPDNRTWRELWNTLLYKTGSRKTYKTLIMIATKFAKSRIVVAIISFLLTKYWDAIIYFLSSFF